MNWTPEMQDEPTEVLLEEFEHDGEMGVGGKRVLVCEDHKRMVIIDGGDEEIAELFSFQLCVCLCLFGMNFMSESERAYGLIE
ncbi:hypothetical protein TSUD_09400 [Trifolium subterraneum]|nr:hypothetical protein TSUD_09400 [Trifolium subterraneum]